MILQFLVEWFRNLSEENSVSEIKTEPRYFGADNDCQAGVSNHPSKTLTKMSRIEEGDVKSIASDNWNLLFRSTWDPTAKPNSTTTSQFQAKEQTALTNTMFMEGFKAHANLNNVNSSIVTAMSADATNAASNRTIDYSISQLKMEPNNFAIIDEFQIGSSSFSFKNVPKVSTSEHGDMKCVATSSASLMYRPIPGSMFMPNSATSHETQDKPSTAAEMCRSANEFNLLHFMNAQTPRIMNAMIPTTQSGDNSQKIPCSTNERFNLKPANSDGTLLLSASENSSTCGVDDKPKGPNPTCTLPVNCATYFYNGDLIPAINTLAGTGTPQLHASHQPAALPSHQMVCSQDPVGSKEALSSDIKPIVSSSAAEQQQKPDMGHQQQCTGCDKEFPCFKYLKQHEVVHKGDRPFRCNHCEKTFRRAQALKYHMLVHTGERPFQCSQCDKKFFRQEHLRDHEKIHADRNALQCPHCEKKFSCAQSLKVHETVHTVQTPFKCPHCDKEFTHLQYLKQHEVVHTGQKPYRCFRCDKTFPRAGALKYHDLIHHTGKKTYPCSHCPKRFSHPGSVKSHERIHTGERPYQCSYCEKKFAHLSSIKSHERVHTGERPYQCSYCEKKFSCLASVKSHEKVHTGEKPYQCSYCEKKFAHLSSVKSHEKVHTGERPYQCSYCEKKFSCLASVKSHHKVHTGERPYQCSYCEKKFAHLASVKSHEKVHTGEKPYQCAFCDKKFAHLASVKSHEKVHVGETLSMLPL